MPDLTELDRLIEEGLTLYGQGDLDGALLVWEQALSMDPDNAQANSYVDYVRMNYETLTTDGGADESAPFGIGDDEPEYQIEILPGEVKQNAVAPLHMDPTDEGWFMDSEPARHGTPPARASDDKLELTYDLSPKPEPLTLELEAEEPAGRPREPLKDGINFEDTTREYQPGQSAAINELFSPEGVTSEFAPEGTPGFGSPEDVKGFANQITDVKHRDLGFVKPTQTSAPDPDDLPAPPVTRTRRPSASQAPPELKMTLRTPTAEEQPPSATATIELSYTASPADDLISSLPSPKPSHITRDLPSDIVPPHANAAPVRVSIESFELGEPELPPELSVSFNPGAAPRDTATRDFGDKPTQEITHRPQAEPDPLVSAPTRELGLRPPGTRAHTEDEPTGAKAPLDLRRAMAPEGTRHDIVLPFDPIDARTAQILDEVDETAPQHEPKEERTRRRITVLLDRALEWSQGTELDRAVAAVDLALSEDPNSALAQKLIHRNRDTIMNVFQIFLGDLARQPLLARPLHELATAPISPRAAFLLSRVDGILSLDEILDVSGMPRLEAYRYLCQLFLRGILK